ncbi:hypothetical protein Caka_3008 [Coraliomargarita akajimensis DSM 45221]|uniref:Uncharacterized protein n=1 Tax=Coraliomargarita akajimensis (strain DSM 45221 / IAM 15411 / JCM 23193 / KCTC 12865 / 04OKA010-24) TaxID=583355 RepID=D5EHY1_CORAD|nr:hypothetical protein Caka_3008 [Coraliomargarita akajimensis DSM 45221]
MVQTRLGTALATAATKSESDPVAAINRVDLSPKSTNMQKKPPRAKRDGLKNESELKFTWRQPDAFP